MKTAIRYQIRHYVTPNAYSVGMGRKLRTRKAATKLVKRLKKMGFDAFAAPMKISV